MSLSDRNRYDAHVSARRPAEAADSSDDDRLGAGALPSGRYRVRGISGGQGRSAPDVAYSVIAWCFATALAIGVALVVWLMNNPSRN